MKKLLIALMLFSCGVNASEKEWGNVGDYAVFNIDEYTFKAVLSGRGFQFYKLTGFSKKDEVNCAKANDVVTTATVNDVNTSFAFKCSKVERGHAIIIEPVYFGSQLFIINEFIKNDSVTFNFDHNLNFNINSKGFVEAAKKSIGSNYVKGL